MNRLKRVLSLVFAVLIFATINSFSLMAYAQEQGTESNPYQITTAQELQNINDNVSAHYKLMADIDLKNMDFTPIGNADSGAFSGSFDGNGYTISNLNVFSGKYAGLFGYNEGTIKNVTLKDIYVYGTRYLGGVVAENTLLGTIADCKVLSGKIESAGGLNGINAGGICGSNNGAFEGEFSNGANLEIKSNNASARAGGIIGWNNFNFSITAVNTGNVSSDSYSGGLIGCGSSTVTITNSSNTGNVSSYSYSGGLIGYVNSLVTIRSSSNTGNIYCRSTNYSASSGGLIGYGGGNISESFNSGKISAYNAGGLVGICAKGMTTNINNSYNSGNISNDGILQCKLGGFVGYMSADYPSNCSYLYVSNCYNSGNIYVTGSGSNVGYGVWTNRILGYGDNGCYYSRTQTYSNSNSYCTTIGNTGYMNVNYLLIDDNMKNKEKFIGWDFDSIWEITDNINNGYPTLKNCNNELKLNFNNYYTSRGKTFKLYAYKNGVAANDITWSCSYGDATVTNDGVVTISGKIATITATDNNGNKENCNIYAFTPANSISMTDKIINISNSSILNNYSIIGGSGDYIIDWKSSDESIVTVSSYDGSLTPKSVGTATITATTMGGAVGTQKITVINSATKISLSNSSMTVARGTTKQLKSTTNPSPTSSKITWTSSDTNVATVDQNGNVTGIGIGSATITAATDNGYSATCSVTINAPITSMGFENPSITVYKGDAQKLNLIYAPSDTTDSISYSSSDRYNLSVDSTGTITAKYTGTYTITATASSGVKAYCTVKVIDYPVIVTDITLDQEEHGMLVGEVFKLNATVTPSNATDKTVTWASTDESVATVSQGGTVEAKGAGKTVITATTQNGIIAYCIVNVTGVASTNRSRIYVPDILATDSEYVDIPVMIENNPGISFASINVSYDSERLEPVEVTNGTIFNSVTGSFDKDNSQVKLYFTNDNDVIENGNLAFVKFKVLKTEETSTLVKVIYLPGDIRNANDDNVSLNLSDGRIEIELCIHDNTELRNAKAATCTEQGYSGDLYCLDCGDLIEKGEFIEMIPHSYEETIVEATENKKGYTKHLCSVCGYSYIDNITDYASDNSVLLAALAQIESYSAEDYSKDSYDALMSVYDSYSDLRNQNISQIEIDNAVFDLLTAISGLEPYLNLNVSAPNGTFIVSYNNESNSNTKHSLLFGTEITLSAIANEGYEFVGWYDTINNLYFSKNAEYSFKITSNTSLKAVFVKEQSASLIFTTYSNWVQSTVTKTIDEWNSITSIDSLLPAVPYKYGYSNGRWVYDNETVLAKLQTGEDVYLIPEYDEDDTSLPTPSSPKGDTPVLDLYYKLDADANVGSFVMAAGIPKDCKLESVGVAFYYKKANEFDPTKFELLINNKMLVSRFNTEEIEDIYIVNMNKLSSKYNWAARGYVTYYDADGNLKTAYSNQVNIVNREQV